MGQARISCDHRGSSAAGDAPEPTRLRAGRRHALKRGWWDSEKRQKLLQHIKKSPQSVDTERGNGGRPQAVSSGASPAAELPLWSQLIRACPIPLGRLQLIQAASCLCVNLSIL